MANIAALLAALANLPQLNNNNPLLTTPGINPNAPTPLSAPTFQPDTSVLPTALAAPEAPPAAPRAPIDPGIIQQYLQLAGSAPTPPPPQAPMGTLGRIALALQGFGAGVQGYGPQFLQQIQEQRQRPQREYEEQQRQYEQRRGQLGLRGLEAAQSAEERRQDRESRAAEKQFDRDFESFIRRNNITDQMALDKIREAREIQLVRERERVADERLEAQQRAQKERDARVFEHELVTKSFAPQKIAKELAEYNVGLIPQLSPAAEKWRSVQAQKAQAQLARLTTGGAGAGGTGKSLATIVGPDGTPLGTLPYNQIKFDRAGDPIGFPEGSKIRLQNQPKQATQPTQPAGGGQESAERAKFRASAKAEGHSDKEITDYLNRIGIK